MAKPFHYSILELDYDQITVDAPISAFFSNEEGYFTLFTHEDQRAKRSFLEIQSAPPRLQDLCIEALAKLEPNIKEWSHLQHHLFDLINAAIIRKSECWFEFFSFNKSEMCCFQDKL
jgi:hypothetical protein